MSSVTTRKSAPLNPPAANRGIHALLSPGLWGPLLTVGFYVTFPRLPIDREVVSRLYAGHWTLHLEIGLFLFGLASLVSQAIGLIHERRSLKMVVIDAASLDGIESPADRARALHLATAGVPAGIRRTKLMHRIREACDYVVRRGSGAGVEDHLRYLADLAVENLSSRFSLLRTLIWTVPGIGLLGTILTVTTALRDGAGGDQEGSLPAVVTGLGGAGDPVALGLGLSLVLVFGKLLMERSEARTLALVEQFGIDELAPCLCGGAGVEEGIPFVAAEKEAAANLLDKTESLITWQTAQWQEALEGLRNRWLETAQQQQAQFTKALEQGMTASLASHSQQLEEARGDFLKAFRSVGLELSRITAGLQQMGEEHQSQFHQQVGEVWQAMQAHMSTSQGEHEQHLAHSVELLEKAVRGWQDGLANATAAMTAQLHELQRHGEMLQNVAGQEDELVRLQTTLTHNLQSVRAMEKFEESIDSLNAAVHLLTMRTKAHAA